MRTTTPDEAGWFWLKSPHDDTWCMAFVNTNRDTITVFDGVDPTDCEEIPIDAWNHEGWHWYGPFHCPGTDFGQHTIVLDEEQHQKAERSGEAIVVTHVDFSHCDGIHSLITFVGRQSAGDAKALTRNEVRTISVESRLIALCRELDAELDGLRLPATTAAIVNAIRITLARMEDDA